MDMAEWENDVQYSLVAIAIGVAMICFGLIWLFGAWALIAISTVWLICVSYYLQHLKRNKPTSIE